MVYGGLDLLVTECGVTTLTGHHTGSALETVDGIGIQGLVPGRDSCRPGFNISHPGCTRNTSTVAGNTGTLIDLYAIDRQCRCGSGHLRAALRHCLGLRHIDLPNGGDTGRNARAVALNSASI